MNMNIYFKSKSRYFVVLCLYTVPYISGISCFYYFMVQDSATHLSSHSYFTDQVETVLLGVNHY